MRQPPTTSQWKVLLSFIASLYGTMIFCLLCMLAYWVHHTPGGAVPYPYGVWWRAFTVNWHLAVASIAMMVWGWPVLIRQLIWNEEAAAELRKQFGKEVL